MLKRCWNLVVFTSPDCWEQPLTVKNVEINLIPGEFVGLFQYVRGFPSAKGRAAKQKCSRVQDTKVKKKTHQQQQQRCTTPKTQGLITRSKKRVGSTIPSRKPWATWPESWQEPCIQPSSCEDGLFCQRTERFDLQGKAQMQILHQFSKSAKSVDVSACPDERLS